MAIKRRPQLDRPGQPQGDALRQRILQERRDQQGDIPMVYDMTRETRPKEKVDRGERPVPLRGSPRMDEKLVAGLMQTTGAPQGDLGSATDPSYDTAPFAQQAQPVVKAGPQYPNHAKQFSQTTIEDMARTRLNGEAWLAAERRRKEMLKAQPNPFHGLQNINGNRRGR